MEDTIKNLDSTEESKLANLIKKISESFNEEKKGNDNMSNKLDNLSAEELAAIAQIINKGDNNQPQIPMPMPSLKDSIITIGKYAGTAVLGGLGYKFFFNKKHGMSAQDSQELIKSVGELFKK